MGREQLIETTFAKPGKIDRDAKVIHDVKVLGRDSGNGYEYSDKALKSACALYEGRQVNIDHPARMNASVERGIRECVGILKSPRVGTDGVYADLHYLESHPDSGILLERAERFPESFGLSHNAEGDKKSSGGKVIIEDIDVVYSVDVVSRPATTKSLFESKDKTMKRTIKDVLSNLPHKTPGRTLLLEQVEAGVVPEALPVEIPTESETAEPDPKVAIKAAFKAAVVAVLDNEALGVPEQMAQIKEILKAKDKVETATSTKTEETPTTESESTEPSTEVKSLEKRLETMESKNRTLETRDHCRGLLESSTRVASDTEFDVLCGMESDHDRKVFLARLPEARETDGRPQRSASIMESQGSDDDIEKRWGRALDKASA